MVIIGVSASSVKPQGRCRLESSRKHICMFAVLQLSHGQCWHELAKPTDNL